MKLINYSIIVFVALILLVNISSAIEELPPVQMNKCANLPQVESNSLYQNLTYIQKPDGTKVNIYKYMTKNGYTYNWSYCDTTQLGTYLVNGCSDLSCWTYKFQVTPSGNTGVLGLFIVAFGIIYLVAFFGFFGRNEWVAMFGGMAMIILGLFTINNGIDVFRNDITNVISWVTIGLGAMFSLVSGVSIINENI